MRLAAFIRANIEPISDEWEWFAATLLPEEEFSVSVLRDAIVDMLNEIANDMDHAQNAAQQKGKSQGDPRSRPIQDVAEQHAMERVQMGLSSRQVISEFRALRATVIRLWQRDTNEVDHNSVYDLIRFNEAIDQALTQATAKHTDEIERSRELFLGILGHDLRNPLSAITGFAELQLRAPERYGHVASQILICAGRMSRLITDLMELTRVRVGSGILIKPRPADLGRICSNAIAEMQAIYPNHTFVLNCDGEFPGEWDAARISQVLSNLLGNATQHGQTATPITVSCTKCERGVELSVHNMGPPIPPEIIPRLFDSLFQVAPDEVTSNTSVGLGLYIAKRIISAHGGTIDVHSSEAEGTTFTVQLPRASVARKVSGSRSAAQ